MKPNEVAAQYIGQREQLNNKFDPSTPFGAKIRAVGQKDGFAWCDFFVEMCMKEADPGNEELYEKLFTGSAVATFAAFKKHGFKVINSPIVDCIVTWQQFKDGVPGWQGHTGIVSKVNADGTFESIEGNTNAAGGREGIEVARRPHRLNYDTNTGLRLLGFIKV